MTTTSHVLAACGRLRTAWGWLATSTTPGRARPNQRTLNERQIAKRNERAVQERSDVRALVNAGRIVGGGQPPANVAAIDARTRIADDVDQLAAELSLAVATVHRVGAHYTSTASTDARFAAALDWISTRAHLLTDQHLINTAHEGLSRADTLARNLVGDNGDRRRFASPCPCCSRRSLVWDHTSPEDREWFVECTADVCRCAGTECPCSIPGRQGGMRHLWTTENWRTLAGKLEEP